MVDKAGLQPSADTETAREGAAKEGTAPAIHLPGPSIWPAVLAFGVALMLFGIISSYAFSVVGLAAFVWALVMWISQIQLESVAHATELESSGHESAGQESAGQESDGSSPDHDAHAAVNR